MRHCNVCYYLNAKKLPRTKTNQMYDSCEVRTYVRTLIEGSKQGGRYRRPIHGHQAIFYQLMYLH